MLKPHIQQLLEEYVDDEANHERLLLYLRIGKAHNYYKGIQYIAPNISSTGVVSYTQVGSPVSSGDGQQGVLDYNFNETLTLGRKFTATLGQRPFYSLKAVANDPQSENDRQAAREADKGSYILDSWWNPKIRNLEMANHAWRSGTIFPHVRYVADGNKYGYYDVPVLDTQDIVIEPAGYQCNQCGTKSPELAVMDDFDEDGQPTQQTECPECHRPLDESSYVPATTAPVPVDNGRTQKYPNGRVELHFFTGLHVTVPLTAPSFKESPYIDRQSEEHIGQLVSLYPELRDADGEIKIPEGGNGGMEQSGIIARSADASQIASPRQLAGKTTRTHRITWLRPYYYELVKDRQARDLLKQKYPEALKAVRIGKDIIRLEHENPDDHIDAVQPEVGDFIFRDGICWGILQHEDMINDTVNNLAEIVERANTVTLAWASLGIVDALSSRGSVPCEYLEVQDGTNFEAAMHTMPSPTFPKEGPALVTMAKDSMQSQSGVLPPIFGAGNPQETAEQNRNDLNQALMQLGTTGEYMSEGWIRIKTLGIWELGKHTDKIDINVLKSGNWHFEGQPGLPRTYAERKDELKALVQQNPQLATALKIDAPINIGVVTDYLDLPDMKNPDDGVRMFIAEAINELLQGQPIQQPAQPGGPPAPPMPSSTTILDAVDAGLIDPAAATELIRDWALDDAGRKLAKSPGYQNVLAVMAQLKQMAAQSAPPPPEPHAGFNVSGKLETMAPDVQVAVLNKMGVQVPPPQPGAPPPASPPPPKMPTPDGAEPPKPPKMPPTGDKPPQTGAGGNMSAA